MNATQFRVGTAVWVIRTLYATATSEAMQVVEQMQYLSGDEDTLALLALPEWNNRRPEFWPARSVFATERDARAAVETMERGDGQP